MINPDALPLNKQEILARWAALYPEAFALAAAAPTNTGLHLRRINQARRNLADLNTPPSAVQPFPVIRFGLPPSATPPPQSKGNHQFSTTPLEKTKALA